MNLFLLLALVNSDNIFIDILVDLKFKYFINYYYFKHIENIF